MHTLRFIQRARDLGRPIERIRLLVGLWRDKRRSSADVKRIATEHVAELRTKIAELAGMCEALEHLAAACYGDHRPECPILHDLESGERADRSAARKGVAEGPGRCHPRVARAR